jgi:hypothetical protein
MNQLAIKQFEKNRSRLVLKRTGASPVLNIKSGLIVGRKGELN